MTDEQRRKVELAAECLGDLLTALATAKEGYALTEDKAGQAIIKSLTQAITDIKELLNEVTAA